MSASLLLCLTNRHKYVHRSAKLWRYSCLQGRAGGASPVDGWTVNGWDVDEWE